MNGWKLTKVAPLVLIPALATVVTAAAPQSVQAAFPGANGKIAYADNGSLYTINEDGSGKAYVGKGLRSPAFSPGGKLLAAVRRGAIVVLRPDGSGLRTIVPGTVSDAPAWSPSAKEIAYVRTPKGGTVPDLYVVNVKTKRSRRITRTPTFSEGHPSWSPNGKRVLYAVGVPAPAEMLSVIYTIAPSSYAHPRLVAQVFGRDPVWAPDGTEVAYGGISILKVNSTYYTGTNPRDLTKDLDGTAMEPAWSPDGTKIAFSYLTSDRDAMELWLIKSDGGSARRVTTFAQKGPTLGHSPDWQPVR